jgi:FlaG/FlaF family flagellin (archaellin)
MDTKNKRALSEIVSYVLLIIIAVALSILVYSFLKAYVIKDRLSCPDDISLVVKEAVCNVNPDDSVRIRIVLENKGLFNVTDYYARMAKDGKEAKLQINQGKTTFIRPLSPGSESEAISFFSSTGTSDIYTPVLKSIVNLSQTDSYILEIEPAVKTSKGLALCTNAIITQPVKCGI